MVYTRVSLRKLEIKCILNTTDNAANKVNQIHLPILSFRSSSDSIDVIDESILFFICRAGAGSLCCENCDLYYNHNSLIDGKAVNI